MLQRFPHSDPKSCSASSNDISEYSASAVSKVGTLIFLKINFQGFPGGAVVENLPANAGDTGSSPGLG